MLPPVKRTYPLDFQPMKFADDSNSDDDIDPHPITIQNNNNNNNDTATFEGVEIKDLQTVLAHAPEEVDLMLACLKDKKLLKELSHRFNFFYRRSRHR